MKWTYTAYDQTGRTVNGTLESADTLSAAETLRRKGLYVADIGAAGQGARSPAGTGRRSRRCSTSSSSPIRIAAGRSRTSGEWPT